MAWSSIIVSISTALFEFLGRGKLIVVIPYGFIVPILVLIPRLILFNKRVSAAISPKWLESVEKLIFAVIAFNIPGSLIFHDSGIQYDWLLHFMSAFLAFIVFLIFYLLFLKLATKEIKKDKIFIVSLGVLFLGLFLWEGYQYTIDQIFGTKLFFDINQPIVVDFWDDIIFGSLGLGAALIYAKIAFKDFLDLFR